MQTSIFRAFGSVLLILEFTKAQINLGPIPTTACAGQGLSGSATYSTTMTLATGSQVIPEGAYWNQEGAQWVFNTDTSDIYFGYLALGNGPDAPVDQESCLILDDSKTKWTLVAPTTSGASQVDIDFTAGSSIAGSSTTGPSTTPGSTTTAAPVLHPEQLYATGAKFRHRRQAALAGSFSLTISGSLPCSDVPGVAGGNPPGPTSANNPTQASLCSNSGISTGTAAWTAYGVDSYLSSVLAAAATSALYGQVDAAAVLTHDVGAANECQYTAECPNIDCNAIIDSSTGSDLTIQRFLAYNAFVNLNNFFYTIVSTLKSASSNALGITSTLATTFYTDPPPAATWNQILGEITPFLGILGGGLGAAGAGVASSLTSVISGVLGEAAGVQATNAGPVMDMRFTEQADIATFTEDYLQATYPSFELAYERTIGNATAESWTVTEYGTTAVMGGGIWSDQPYTDDFANTMLDNFDKILSFKMINYLWNASDTFVVYVKYGPVMLTNDQMGTVSVDDCNGWKTSNNDPFLNCNVPGPGMARVFNPNNAHTMDTTNPMGATSGYKMGIASPIALDIGLATAGSVASWLAGNFNYDLSQEYSDLANGVLSSTDVTNIQALQITQDEAGFFNMPVCQVEDLRSFPPASQGTQYSSLLCGCASTSAVGGASNGGDMHFWDYVTPKVTVYTNPPPPPSRTGFGTTSCPDDLFPAMWNGS